MMFIELSVSLSYFLELALNSFHDVSLENLVITTSVVAPVVALEASS